MTRLPCEQVRITQPPPGLPVYHWREVCPIDTGGRYVCAGIGCRNRPAEGHHVVRRSFIRSWPRKDWVLVDGQPMRNVIGVCGDCHRLLTEGGHSITYHNRCWYWQTPQNGAMTILQPPNPSDAWGDVLARAARPSTPPGSTTTWAIQVPEDAENGSAILDRLLIEARSQLGLPEWSAPYYVLAAALAAVVQGQTA